MIRTVSHSPLKIYIHGFALNRISLTSSVPMRDLFVFPNRSVDADKISSLQIEVVTMGNFFFFFGVSHNLIA